MSPEYASASMVHDYPGLAATLAQLNQQRLAALAAMNNVQSNLYPCSNLSSSSSINFNLFTNPPLNSPFDHNLNSNIVGPNTSTNNATSNNNSNAFMNNFLTSVNTLQHPLLFSNPHSLHDMMMLTTTSTTAVPTNLLNGVQSSTGSNILSHNGFLVDTDSSSNYGAVDIDQNILKQQQQQQSQQQNQQIYEAYNLPSPSAPVYYPAHQQHHQIMSSTPPSSMGQYFPCVSSTQPLVISSISQQPLVPLSVTKVSNNNNTNNNSNNNIANNSTLVGRGFGNNEYKSPKQDDLDIGQLKHRSDMNKTDFNSKSTLTTNSNYRVSDHNPWIKASNLNRYDTEQQQQQQQQPHQHQRRQHENVLPPTPSSPPPPPPPPPPQAAKSALKNH
ncbi:unnamed protein product [Trichobilharzia regenti]|nr:unnamed protein product [Trichobilharzia regenti]